MSSIQMEPVLDNRYHLRSRDYLGKIFFLKTSSHVPTRYKTDETITSRHAAHRASSTMARHLAGLLVSCLALWFTNTLASDQGEQFWILCVYL